MQLECGLQQGISNKVTHT